jgi:membrane protein
MIKSGWALLKDAVLSFMEDEALSRGAAIAFFAVTSLGPLMLIVVAIAGLIFGHDAARAALTGQLHSLMGQQSAAMLQGVMDKAGQQSSGIWGTILGVGTLIVTASGVFGEMQSALNKIWHAEPKGSTVSRLVKARAASLGLVATLGFLLIVSLAVSAALTAFGDFLNALLPFGKVIVSVLNVVISFALLALLFGAIYKILPDRPLVWSDVVVGAVTTSLLFTIGKSLIGLYLGSSAVASSYGAAGALLLVMLWTYYSSQIFLLGSEFTKVYAEHHGSRVGTHEAAPR